MSIPENPFAFPFPGERAPDGTGIYEGSLGMTLRDWFAGQALAGVMVLCAEDTLRPGETVPQAMARKSFEMADAMLAERVRS